MSNLLNKIIPYYVCFINYLNYTCLINALLFPVILSIAFFFSTGIVGSMASSDGRLSDIFSKAVKVLPLHKSLFSVFFRNWLRFT